MGLGFNPVANQKSSQYPMSPLKSEDFTHRGYCYGFFSGLVKEGVSEIIAFAWVDYDR